MVLNTTLFNQLGGSEKDIEDLIQQGTGSPAISLNSTKYENIRLSSVGGYFFWTGVWSELSLPNCTYITTCAFGRMTKLTSITLPWSKITVIGQSAFGSNTLLQLDSIECPICSYVGSNAFSSCLGLTEVNFSTATTIYTSAFTGCLNLKYANFPSATTIQPYAFHNCQKLISAYFGAATTIQSEIFRNCYKLENISMPKLQVIGSRAVGYCSSLKSVYLPSGRYFNQYAFEYDTYLNTFVINQGSTSAAYFGQYTFGHCYRLKSLYLLGASVISLANTNVFLSTPISTYTNYTGGVNGSIYVPSSLYATYIASNIWSTYAARFVSMTDQEIEDFLNNPIDVEAQFT